MAKKATLRDVANMAGVSVATASYVMNNRPDQKISEATRKKVLQIANLLDYSPNPTAKSLAGGRSNLIGIVCRLRPETPSRNLEVVHFVDLLAERLNRLHYNAVLIPLHGKKAADNGSFSSNSVGCMIAVDLSQEEFSDLADNVYVPVLCVDMLVNHFLFYQIYSDLPARIVQAAEALGTAPEDTVLLTEEFSNRRYLDFVAGSIPAQETLFVSAGIWSSQADRLLSPAFLRDRKLIVIGAQLARVAESLVPRGRIAVISSDPSGDFIPEDFPVIHNDVAKKANVTISILLNALDKKFDVTHDYRI